MWTRSSELAVEAENSPDVGGCEDNRLIRGCERRRCSARKIVLRMQVLGKDGPSLSKESLFSMKVVSFSQRTHSGFCDRCEGSTTASPSLSQPRASDPRRLQRLRRLHFRHAPSVRPAARCCNSCQRVVKHSTRARLQ